jgi:hypothetical protein
MTKQMKTRYLRKFSYKPPCSESITLVIFRHVQIPPRIPVQKILRDIFKRLEIVVIRKK